MRKVDVSLFFTLLSKKSGKTERECMIHRQLLELFDILYSLDVVEEESLDLFTEESIEWLDDMIQYWPTHDTESEDIDRQHPGVEQELIWYWLSEQMTNTRSVKKERFI